MKLLLENWREYIKEETVDEAWNPFGKQDIVPPKEKRNKKEAQISGEDFKLAEEIFEYTSSFICKLSHHREAGDTAEQAGFTDRDCEKWGPDGFWEDDDNQLAVFGREAQILLNLALILEANASTRCTPRRMTLMTR